MMLWIPRAGSKPAGFAILGVVMMALSPTASHDRARRSHPVRQTQRHDDAERELRTSSIDSLERLGEFPAAVRLVRDGIERDRRRGATLDVVKDLTRVAVLEDQEGEYPRAIEDLQTALSLADRGSGVDPITRSEILAALGRAEKDRGLYEASREHYEEAIDLARREGLEGRPALARALTGKANLIRRRSEKRPEAVALLEQALKVALESGSAGRFDTGEIRMDLALALLQLGRLPEADQQLRLALPIVLARKGKDHPDVGLLYSLKGWDEYLCQRPREAEGSFRRAMAIAEAARLRTQPGEGRRRYVQRVAPILAASLLAQGKNQEAWSTLDRGLSGYLVERMRGHEPSFEATHGDGELRTDVQRVLDEKTALVGWLEVKLVDEAPIETWGYVLRCRGPVRWVKLRASSFGTQRDSSRASALWSLLLRDSRWPLRVTETQEVDDASRDAWREGFAPLEPFLRGVDRLVAVNPWGRTSLPLETLVDDTGRSLLDRFQISYIPSARLLLELRARFDRSRGERRSGLLLVRAHEKGPAAALAGMGREWVGIATLFPRSRSLTGDATGPELRAMNGRGDLARFSLLHFATHAVRGPQWPGFGALFLGGDREPRDPTSHDPARVSGRSLDSDWGDGVLTAHEIEHWKLGPSLVVLSGCQTSGLQFFGQLPGPAESFLVAGAGGVIVSLWNVEDRSTSLLMTRFYRVLASRTSAGDDRPCGAACALREAKQWLRDFVDRDGRRPFRNPVYWAGFVFIGCEEPTGRVTGNP